MDRKFPSYFDRGLVNAINAGRGVLINGIASFSDTDVASVFTEQIRQRVFLDDFNYGVSDSYRVKQGIGELLSQSFHNLGNPYHNRHAKELFRDCGLDFSIEGGVNRQYSQDGKEKVDMSVFGFFGQIMKQLEAYRPIYSTVDSRGVDIVFGNWFKTWDSVKALLGDGGYRCHIGLVDNHGRGEYVIERIDLLDFK